MNSNFHIVYPRGIRTKLAVVEILHALSYELSDYAVASRKSFSNERVAILYAKQLAKDNNLILELDSDQYLD